MHWTRAAIVLAIVGLTSATGVVRADRPQQLPGTPVPTTSTAPGFPVPSLALPAVTGGVIVGIVADAATGRGVSQALVTLTGPDANTRRLTDDKGRFFFKDVAPGEFSMTAAKAGFLNGEFAKMRPAGTGLPLTLVKGQWMTNVRIDLWRPATIDGQVVDDAGEPVVAARVRALRRAFVGGRPHLVNTDATTLTDDLGFYRLTDLEPGEYLVTVPALQASVPADVLDRATDTGVGGGDLFAVASRARAAGGTTSADVVTDADGRTAILAGAVDQPPAVGGAAFVYPGLFYPGVADAWAGQTITIASGGHRSAVNFQRMPVPAARVSGRLVGPPEALRSAVVRLIRLGHEDLGSGTETAITVAAADGTFTFPVVPMGDYTLEAGTEEEPATPSASTPRYGGDVPVWVTDHDVTDVTVAMQRRARLSGRLTFTGPSPIPAASALKVTTIVIERADGRGDEVRCPVDADGKFAAPGLAPGQYFLRVPDAPAGWSFDAATHAGRDVSIDALDVWSGADVEDVVVTFTDQPTQIRGTVRDARGGFTSTATVLIWPADARDLSDYGEHPRRVRSVRAAVSGIFAIDGLPPGAYLFAAIDEADADNWQDPGRVEVWRRTATPVTLRAGEKKTQDLRLAPKR